MVLWAGLQGNALRRSAKVLETHIGPLIGVSATRPHSAGTAKGQPCKTRAQGTFAGPALKHSCGVTLNYGKWRAAVFTPISSITPLSEPDFSGTSQG